MREKVINVIDSNNCIMTINTSRLDVVYIEGKSIHFALGKLNVNTGEYNTRKQAEDTKKKFVEDWRS